MTSSSSNVQYWDAAQFNGFLNGLGYRYQHEQANAAYELFLK